jgi:hypothetical protein
MTIYASIIVVVLLTLLFGGFENVIEIYYSVLKER